MRGVFFGASSTVQCVVVVVVIRFYCHHVPRRSLRPSESPPAGACRNRSTQSPILHQKASLLYGQGAASGGARAGLSNSLRAVCSDGTDSSVSTIAETSAFPV